MGRAPAAVASAASAMRTVCRLAMRRGLPGREEVWGDPLLRGGPVRRMAGNSAGFAADCAPCPFPPCPLTTVTPANSAGCTSTGVLSAWPHRARSISTTPWPARYRGQVNTVRLEPMTSRHRPPSHRLQANGITPSLWLEQRRRGVNGRLSGALAVMTFKRRVSALDHPRPSLLKRAYRFELTAGLQQLIEPTRPQSWLLWGERPRSGAGRGAATAHAS